MFPSAFLSRVFTKWRHLGGFVLNNALLVFTLTWLLQLSIPPVILSQDGTEPAMRITQVDTASFPTVAVQVASANLGVDALQADLTLLEDNQPQTIVERRPIEIGTQTALVFDAAGNVRQRGPTGEPLYLEVGLAARRLVELRLLAPERDRLMSISFGEDEKLAVLRPWSGDHQAVVDSLYIYEPVDGIGNTPLSDLILYTIKQFDNKDLRADQEKAIVVFSDGVNAAGNTELIDAITEAQRNNIRLHEVMIGRSTPDTQRNMSRLAAMTGGRYVALSAVDALDELWRSIGATSQQQVLTYRSTQAQPRAVTVETELADGRKLSSEAMITSLDLLPVEVRIAAPPAGLVVERTAAAFDTPVDQLEPKTIDVLAQFAWLDDKPRSLTRVEYQVGDNPPVVRTDQFDQPLLLDISSLDEGDYGLRVRATDELGLVGESEALPFRVIEMRPLAPTPTPDATLIAEAQIAKADAAAAKDAAEAAKVQAGQQVSETQRIASGLQAQLDSASQMMQRLSWITLASAGLAVAALGFAIYVLVNKDRRRRATEVISGTMRAVTEPFVRGGKKGGGSAQSGARLTLVDASGGAGLPMSIPIHGNTLRIGREPSLVNVVVDDRRVSRLHCRVSLENGGYRILDEGSTSGTFVNDTEVGMNGHMLQPGDVVSFGPVNYRFDVDGMPPPTATADTQQLLNRAVDDNTAPYVKSPARHP